VDRSEHLAALEKEQSTMKKILGRVALVLLVLAIVKAVVTPRTRRRQLRRQCGREIRRRARFALGRWEGMMYRLQGRQPRELVADDVLADRIRSELGTLEKRLDVPHLNVTVEGRVALLHGVVGDDGDAAAIERAVSQIAGVRGVVSYLHRGFTRSDSRPSAGAAVAKPSDALERLLAAVSSAGPADHPQSVLRGVLSTFAEYVPSDERGHLLTHLPSDVRELVEPPRRRGARRTHGRHLDEFVSAVVAADGLDQSRASYVIESVLGVLRELVPEEAGDIAAVLPRELREFWNAAVPH
jgi:uncharacterized protein (DUF2267 family)